MGLISKAGLNLTFPGAFYMEGLEIEATLDTDLRQH